MYRWLQRIPAWTFLLPLVMDSKGTVHLLFFAWRDKPHLQDFATRRPPCIPHLTPAQLSWMQLEAFFTPSCFFSLTRSSLRLSCDLLLNPLKGVWSSGRSDLARFFWAPPPAACSCISTSYTMLQALHGNLTRIVKESTAFASNCAPSCAADRSIIHTGLISHNSGKVRPLRANIGSGGRGVNDEFRCFLCSETGVTFRLFI